MTAGLEARRDAAVCVLLFAGVVLYLAAMPRNLGVADESYFLLESKRIARGEVLYRDIFYFAAPGAHWLMALVFRCFGVSMTVARLSLAVVHGAIAVVVMLACRALGVRRGIALAAGVAHTAICQPVWPFASNHWLCTFLMVLLLLVVLRGRPWAESRASACVPGLIVGGLAAVQQQGGAAMAVGVSAFFVLNGLVAARYGEGRPLVTALRQVGATAAGAAAVLLPLAAGLLASIGMTPLYEQLVVFPLQNYRRYHPHVAWAGLSPMSTQWTAYTYLPLLTWLRWVIGVDVVRAAVHWARRADRTTLEGLIALATLCAAAAVSIMHFPDFIHVAYVAPLFLVAIAETIEAAVQPAESAIRRPRVLGWAVASVLIAVLAVQLYRNLTRARTEFPFPAETAFGHVDFASGSDVDIVRMVRDVMRNAPGRPFFAYPVWTSLYLTADVDNPTRYPALIPDYNSPEQFAEVLRDLEAKQPAYFLNCPFVSRPDDPVVQYLRDHYEFYAPGPVFCRLYRRRAAPAQASQ